MIAAQEIGLTEALYGVVLGLVVSGLWWLHVRKEEK